VSPVKPGKQAQRSRETRRRIVAAARDLFTGHGYGATTLQEVADRAGVAVQTIYFVFGNKRSLLKEVVDTSIAGDDEPVATMDRDWFRAAVAARTAQEQLRELIHGTGQIIERTAPVMEVVRTAMAIDPEVAAEWPQDRDPRFTVQTAAAAALVAKPGARAGISAGHAADVLYGILSPELYLLLVRDRDWTPAQWEAWAYATLCGQLCEGGQDAGTEHVSTEHASTAEGTS
jgi:AcrR family transcriptional regulator